jgi:hypothetical protein
LRGDLRETWLGVLPVEIDGKVNMESKVQQLIDRGFDLSRYYEGDDGVTVWCSQCEALVINGVACHETGCPNQVRENSIC